MRNYLIKFAPILSLVVCGCQSPVSTPASTVAKVPALPAFSVGESYVFSIEPDATNKMLSYEGTIKEIGEETVVLTDVVVDVEQESTDTLIENIPYVQRLFKNVSRVRSKVDGTITISFEKIQSAKPTLTKSPGHTEGSILQVP